MQRVVAGAWQRAFGGAGTLGDVVLGSEDSASRQALDGGESRREDAVITCVPHGLELLGG